MSKVSIFNSVSEVNNPQYMGMIEYLEKTRDGEWEDIVTACRLIKDKDSRNEMKRNMPTTTLSGEFKSRNDQSLVNHSGFIAMDIDDVENLAKVKRTLENDKYVFSVFMSTSGKGLRAIFKIDAKKHREAFMGITDYLFTKYDIVCDP
jgi:glucose-6-phosphate 1-dehydrogenase